LLAYDIRNPRRLRRVHYFVKKRGVALQKSVFLLRADQDELALLSRGIKKLVNEKEDDVRLYPVRHPGKLWSAGTQQNRVDGLYVPVPESRPGFRDKLAGLLFGRKK